MVDTFQLPLSLAFSGDESIAAIAVTGGLLIAIVGIVSGTVTRIVKTRAFEASRREIAAYVAEGTIKPDEAAKLLEAGRKPGSCE